MPRFDRRKPFSRFQSLLQIVFLFSPLGPLDWVEFHLSEADALGGYLDELVFPDEFDGLVE